MVILHCYHIKKICLKNFNLDLNIFLLMNYINAYINPFPNFNLIQHLLKNVSLSNTFI